MGLFKGERLVEISKAMLNTADTVIHGTISDTLDSIATLPKDLKRDLVIFVGLEEAEFRDTVKCFLYTHKLTSLKADPKLTFEDLQKTVQALPDEVLDVLVVLAVLAVGSSKRQNVTVDLANIIRPN